jgi:hypothetical protein
MTIISLRSFYRISIKINGKDRIAILRSFEWLRDRKLLSHIKFYGTLKKTVNFLSILQNLPDKVQIKFYTVP